MVKIRLRRVGAKKKPTYRFVVTPSRAPRDGRFIENVGHYDPHHEPAHIVVKEDRIFHWLSVGAQPTDSVVRLLKTSGVWERYEQSKAGLPAGEAAEEVAEAAE
jgi:small subunit ribosomal protein S16